MSTSSYPSLQPPTYYKLHPRCITRCITSCINHPHTHIPFLTAITPALRMPLHHQVADQPTSDDVARLYFYGLDSRPRLVARAGAAQFNTPTVDRHIEDPPPSNSVQSDNTRLSICGTTGRYQRPSQTPWIPSDGRPLTLSAAVNTSP